MSLLTLWLVAFFVVGGQILRICDLDFIKIGAMTIAQVYHASRRRLIVALVALVTLSWPLWLQINFKDCAIFRGGKLVQVFNSGTVMLQGTWDKATTGTDVVALSDGEIAMGMEVEMQCPSDGALNGVLIITTDGKNDRDSILKRLEYCLRITDVDYR